ncbi:hypothetical protein ACWD4O_03140 [Streptomyces sp. NPDC002623]
MLPPGFALVSGAPTGRPGDPYAVGPSGVAPGTPVLAPCATRSAPERAHDEAPDPL